MFEKVNPSHPDKVADRIAGAVVDLAYAKEENPKCAVEVLLGHGHCTVIVETSAEIAEGEVQAIVWRIAGACEVKAVIVPQDKHLADNQNGKTRCGDNGIFLGLPCTDEEKRLAAFAKDLYAHFPHDGKYILNDNDLIVCQSNATDAELKLAVEANNEYNAVCNPLGPWTGGPWVDAGATNRKLGSDMGDAVTGGGLHGKDLSKADVSVNIYCHLLAERKGHPVRAFCAIGDEKVCVLTYGIQNRVYVDYEEIVAAAREYVRGLGGFEKFAEWGLVR